MTDQNVAKLQKLTDFKATLNNGAKIVTRSFVLLCTFNRDYKVFEYGIIASKKVGGAVQRNRCKRLLRSAIAAIEHKIKIPVRTVLIARSGLMKQPFDEIVGSLDWALRKLSSNHNNKVHSSDSVDRPHDTIADSRLTDGIH